VYNYCNGNLVRSINIENLNLYLSAIRKYKGIDTKNALFLRGLSAFKSSGVPTISIVKYAMCGKDSLMIALKLSTPNFEEVKPNDTVIKPREDLFISYMDLRSYSLSDALPLNVWQIKYNNPVLPSFGFYANESSIFVAHACTPDYRGPLFVKINKRDLAYVQESKITHSGFVNNGELPIVTFLNFFNEGSRIFINNHNAIVDIHTGKTILWLGGFIKDIGIITLIYKLPNNDWVIAYADSTFKKENPESHNFIIIVNGKTGKPYYRSGTYPSAYTYINEKIVSLHRDPKKGYFFTIYEFD
jgi:hypothetical protein